MAIRYIDGPRFVNAFIAGAQWVATKRAHLNEINVFPVPDGDTGTNLTLTLKAATDAMRPLENRPLGEIAEALSRAVLLGASGNAGVIFAQFMRGFAGELEGTDRLYPPAFAAALATSVNGAYEAMAEPTEGTILTVMREATDEAVRMVDEGEGDFLRIISAMHRTAAESLARTPELLPVLKEAGVVDAGGEGFVDFLEGILRLFRGEDVGDVLDALPTANHAVLPKMKEKDLKYQYCTEFLVESAEVDPDDLRVLLVGMGGSLIVVGGTGLVRVHIHTNSPEKVFEVAERFGDVQSRKIDDMRQQHREFIRKTVSGERQVRIVTDSTADIPDEIAEDLGIVIVPLAVNFDDGSYRDGIDLSREEFYAKLATAGKPPTTSQPTPQDFLDRYEELSWETKAVLSIHISSKMSGTVQSARTAAEQTSGLLVKVIDSRTVSVALGLVVMETARAARRGASLEELEVLASGLSARARVYFTVGTLDCLVKGGRIGRAQALVGKLARVKPILTVEEGEITAAAKAIGDRGVIDKLAELVAPELEGATGGTLGIVQAERPEMVERLDTSFREQFGFDEVAVFELGCIVGTHAGPGTWGVGYLRRGPGGG